MKRINLSPGTPEAKKANRQARELLVARLEESPEDFTHSLRAVVEDIFDGLDLSTEAGRDSALERLAYLLAGCTYIGVTLLAVAARWFNGAASAGLDVPKDRVPEMERRLLQELSQSMEKGSGQI